MPSLHGSAANCTVSDVCSTQVVAVATYSSNPAMLRQEFLMTNPFTGRPEPVCLIGRRDVIAKRAETLGLRLRPGQGVTVLDPAMDDAVFAPLSRCDAAMMQWLCSYACQRCHRRWLDVILLCATDSQRWVSVARWACQRWHARLCQPLR